MSEVHTWSTVAANNNAAPPDGAPENQTRLGDINNAMREIMRSVRAWQADENGSLTSTGSGNSYAVTTNRAVTALFDGFTVTFKVNTPNTGPAFLNVNNTGLAPVRYVTNTDVLPGDWQVNTVVKVVYNVPLGRYVIVSDRPDTMSQLMTTQGDIVVRGATAPQRVAVGASNTVLRGGNIPSYGTIDGNFVSIPGETRGDLFTRGAFNWSRLPLGASGQMLSSNGTDAAWATRPGAVDFGFTGVSGSATNVNVWSDVRLFHYIFNGVAKSGSSVKITLHLGSASGVLTSSYYGASHWDNSSFAPWTNGILLHANTNISSSWALSGRLTVAKMGGTTWVIDGLVCAFNLGTPQSIIRISGNATLPEAITFFHLQCNGEVFTSGTVRVEGVY